MHVFSSDCGGLIFKMDRRRVEIFLKMSVEPWLDWWKILVEYFYQVFESLEITYFDIPIFSSYFMFELCNQPCNFVASFV